MREFWMLPVIAIAGILALLALPIVAAVLGVIGALFWIGERAGWARIGGMNDGE